MPALRPVTSTIDAAADRVWDILGPGFDRIGDWASAIASSTPDPVRVACDAPVGARACVSTVPGVPQVREQLVAYDADARSLTYVATAGMPRFVQKATNTWTVTHDGPTRCRVTVAAELEVSGIIARAALTMLGPSLTRMARRTLDDLRHYAEHGEPSHRKLRHQARSRARASTDR